MHCYIKNQRKIIFRGISSKKSKRTPIDHFTKNGNRMWSTVDILWSFLKSAIICYFGVIFVVIVTVVLGYFAVVFTVLFYPTNIRYNGK